MPDWGFTTRTIHVAQEPEPGTGSVITPIYQTSTYAQEDIGVHKGFEYSRTDNPTRNVVERVVASLENGTHGLAFASGMAAETTIMHLLKSGDHVVAGNDLYGGTFRLFNSVLEKYGLTFSYVDASNAQRVADAMRPETRLVWLETPTNPMLESSTSPRWPRSRASTTRSWRRQHLRHAVFPAAPRARGDHRRPLDARNTSTATPTS